MKTQSKIGLLISVGIAELIGLSSALLAGNSGALYKTLTMPPLSPPGWIFPLVWTILYALMGIAAYWVCNAKCVAVTQKRNALICYALQLFVNFSWSIIFFRFGLVGTAIAVIILLDFLVILMIILFNRIYRPAALILIPYLLWILFATYLNIGIYLLN